MNRILIIKKFLIVILGSSIMGIGIALALSTSLGADPLAWVWVGTSNTFHISILKSNLLIAMLMLMPPLIFDRSQLGIGTIIQQYKWNTILIKEINIYVSFYENLI